MDVIITIKEGICKIKMNLKHKSKKHRGKSRRKNSKKCIVDSKPYGLYLLMLIITLFGLYKIAPESIEFKIILDEEKEAVIREIVRDEFNNLTEPQIVEDNLVAEAQVTAPISSRSLDKDRDVQVTTQNILSGYRITSYYPGDNCASGTKTGSGKSTKDFGTMKIGNKTVYTYNGKIVVAAATKELLNLGYSAKGAQNKQDKHYFKYYDTLTLTIDGQTYEAIVLDSCGAAMWEGQYRVDIFVPSANNVIDRSNVDIIL